MAGNAETPESKVWDLPTRLFHWTLAAFVITAIMTGTDHGLTFHIHTYLGYAILALILFRLAWGFVGGEHARFGDFVRSWPTVRDYLKTVLHRSPTAYAGHNPAGGWMILLMLVVLLVIVITGMVAGVAEGATIPFFTGLPRTATRPIRELHEVLGNAMIGLIVIHLAGVVVDWWLTKDNLVRAMLSGTKPAAIAKTDAREAGWLRAAVIACVVLAFGAYLVLNTAFR